MYFTTLVKAGRYSDKYLKALADKGKMVPRTVADHKKIFEQVGLSAKYKTIGSVLIIEVEN